MEFFHFRGIPTVENESAKRPVEAVMDVTAPAKEILMQRAD